MKLTKNEKGITLVALIITIIVLLILAVVSIRAIKDGGILSKTQTAKEIYLNAKQNELDILKSYEKNIKFKIEEEDILKKAYIFKSNSNIISIVWAEKSESGDLIMKEYAMQEGNTTIVEVESIKVEISSNFEPITVEIDNKKIEINSNNAFCFAIDSRICYISEKYVFTKVQDGGKYTENNTTGGILTRNSDYDKYINN